MTATESILTRLAAKAAADASGFAWAKGPTQAVYVAVGVAAERRKQAGRIVLGVEWYAQERMGDDDVGSFLLPRKSGRVRVAKEIVVDVVDDAARAEVTAAIPSRLVASLGI